MSLGPLRLSGYGVLVLGNHLLVITLQQVLQRFRASSKDKAVIMALPEMLLLRRDLPHLHQLRNQQIGAVVQQRASLRRPRSPNAIELTDSESAPMRYQPRFRSCCRATVTHLQTVHSNRASSTLQCNRNAGPGEFHHCFSYYSPYRAYRASSPLVCRVLSSVVEAHQLTLQPAPEPWSNGVHDDHSHPDPSLNEEAEGAVQEAVANLRALLHLGDDGVEAEKSDYYELLVVADYLERFGLDVYFRQEIKSILDRVFKIWTESSSLSETAALLGDLQCAALAFYLLRSHEYDVQPSVVLLYRREDGKFYKRPPPQLNDGAAAAELEAPRADMGDLVNLLRASDLRFRCDVGLKDASNFAFTALSGVLEDGSAEVPQLSEETAAEVKYRLKYPWAINMRMLETRQTILNFQKGESITAKFPSGRLSSEVLSLMLSTATKLMNGYISQFHEEIQSLQRWSKESGLEEVNVRSSMVILPAFLGMAYDMPQAKYAYAREVYAKIFYLVIVLDDLFDVGASTDHLVVFNDAVKRWDPALLEKLPKDQGPMPIRVIFNALYDVTESWAKKSSVWCGRDLLQTFIGHWMVRLEVFMNERNWLETGYKLDSDAYVNEFAKWSYSTETSVPLVYYSIPGVKVSPSFFTTRPDMKAVFAISKTGRFFNDARSYKYERITESKGKREFVHILMEENPHFTEKDAVEQAEQFAQSALQETTEAILLSGIPHREFRAALLSNFKQSTLLYYFVDGLRNPNHVLSKLMTPS